VPASDQKKMPAHRDLAIPVWMGGFSNKATRKRRKRGKDGGKRTSKVRKKLKNRWSEPSPRRLPKWAIAAREKATSPSMTLWEIASERSGAGTDSGGLKTSKGRPKSLTGERRKRCGGGRPSRKGVWRKKNAGFVKGGGQDHHER